MARSCDRLDLLQDPRVRRAELGEIVNRGERLAVAAEWPRRLDMRAGLLQCDHADSQARRDRAGEVWSTTTLAPPFSAPETDATP